MKFDIEKLKRLKEIINLGIDEMCKRYELMEDKKVKAQMKATIIYTEDLAKELQDEINKSKE